MGMVRGTDNTTYTPPSAHITCKDAIFILKSACLSISLWRILSRFRTRIRICIAFFRIAILKCRKRIGHGFGYTLSTQSKVIAQNVPYSPQWQDLSKLLGIGDERTLKNYFSLLEDADLINLLYKSSKKLGSIDSPAKIYLQNTNLSHVIAKGQENHGSFIEVGGAKKTKKQNWQEDQAYIAAADIEIGIRNKIPLWLFGFLT